MSATARIREGVQQKLWEMTALIEQAQEGLDQSSEDKLMIPLEQLRHTAQDAFDTGQRFHP